MNKRKLDVTTIANASKKQKNNTDINLEEDVIKYYLMPSLQHVSMSNIIIILWNQTDIKYQIVKLFNEYKDDFYTDLYRLFLKIEDKVLEKVLQLPGVPNYVRKILSNIVHPIGYQIFGWIKYQDKFVFDVDCNYEYSKSLAINYIDYLVWTARGVIDYKETAKTLLAKEEKLLDDYKYNIACSYCLEDNIAIIAPKVINTTLTLRCIKGQEMVYFWTAHITGDFTKLDKAVYFYNRKYSTNYNINEYLFKELIDNYCTNQVAIKYIWDKLSNEAKSRQIVPAIKKTPNIDIRCFLLSQISKEQEKEVFKTYDAKGILLGFLDDWLWGQYFLPTIHHVWDIISGCNYLNILEEIVHKMEKNHEDTEKYNQYKSIFKELWQYAPKHLKEYVFEHENGHRCHSILFSLFYRKNVDIIQSILCDYNDIQKKKIIFSYYGFGICHFLITSNQWDLLEMFIGYTLFSKEDVVCFKQALIKEKGQEIAVHFIQNKEWNKVERFLQWAFKSDDDISEFRQNLTYSDICNDMLKSIVANNKVDFTELEHFFKWCVSGDEERVVKRKAEIPELYFEELICKLIEEDKYELLEQILNWCFVYDQKQIVQFKQNFYYDHNFEIVKLVINLIKQDDQLQSFEKLIHWCFINEEEINKFKTFILHPTENTVGVCIELLCEEMFKSADEFVNWCCNSSQIHIDNFKNHLMIDMWYLSEVDDPRTIYEPEVFKWFNPSIETTIRFKEKNMNYDWFKDVLPALDNYIKEQYNQDEAINKDIADILQNLLSDIENQDHDIIHCNDDVTVNLTGVYTEDASVIL